MNNVLKGAEELFVKGEYDFESAKQKISQAVESGSEKLIAGAEAIEGTALHSAESLLNGANYLQTQSPGQMLQDCRSLLKKYPLQSMALAAVAGVFLGKTLWETRPRRVEKT